MEKKKRGKILVENVMFIVLNLVFLTILILFLVLKTGDAAPAEERYAKQIALMLDAARPGAQIILDMEDIKDKKEENWDIDNVVSIEDNVVRVRLGEGKGYSYSFFSDDEVSYQLYPNWLLEINVK